MICWILGGIFFSLAAFNAALAILLYKRKRNLPLAVEDSATNFVIIFQSWFNSVNDLRKF